MGTPKRIQWVVWAIPAILAFYFFAGLATKRTGEIFPVFHWALFANVSETRTGYEIYIREQDGQRFSPSVLLQDTEEYRRWLAASYDVYNTPGVISRFARAYEAGNIGRMAELKGALEHNFLPGDEVRYELLKVEYNPLERYHTGALRSSSLVGTFVKEPYVAGR